MMDLNFSVFFITFLLIILAIVLSRIFFRPIGGILSQRETKVAADSQSLGRILGEIETHTRTLEERFQATHKEASRIKEEFIGQGEETRRRLVEEARVSSQRLLGERMKDMERQLAVAEEELTLQVEAFSNRIRESLL